MHFSQITKQSLATNKCKLRSIIIDKYTDTYCSCSYFLWFSFFEPNTTKKVAQISPNYTLLTTQGLLNVSFIMNPKIYIRICIHNNSIPLSVKFEKLYR